MIKIMKLKTNAKFYDQFFDNDFICFGNKLVQH